MAGLPRASQKARESSTRLENGAPSVLAELLFKSPDYINQAMEGSVMSVPLLETHEGNW